MISLRRFRHAVILLALLTHFTSNSIAQETGSAFSPSRETFTAETALARLKLSPSGEKIRIFASGLGNPRIMAEAPDGSIYFSDSSAGKILRLKPGENPNPETMLSDLPKVHGIALGPDLSTPVFFLISDSRVMRSKILPSGKLGAPETLIDGLPSGGHDFDRTIRVGPDRKLYFSVGSSCNVCIETHSYYATLLRADLNGKNVEILARGLRNTVGFDWDPTSGKLWGMDHGSDWRGNDLPPDELNQIQAGKDYGWPHCFGKQQVDPYFKEAPVKNCALTEPSALEAQAHSAPISLIFVDSNEALVSFHGSWNRNPAVGYQVSRIVFKNGKPIRFEDFLTGFLSPDRKSVIGRPAGLLIRKSGTLLVSDDLNGVIYEITFRNRAAASKT